MKGIILPGEKFTCHIAWSTRADGPMNLIGKEFPPLAPDQNEVISLLNSEAGDSERRANRAQFFARLSSESMGQVVPKLQHGNKVFYVSEQNEFVDDLACDALMTETPKLALTVGFADCPSVVLFDPVTGSLALIHAGWKGIAAEVIEETVRTLTSLGFHPSRALAFVGPGACNCCYEVDAETAMRVDGLFHVGHVKIDLQQIIGFRLVALGFEKENLRFASPRCTICSVDSKTGKNLYYSYRKDQKNDPLDTNMLVAWIQ